MKRMRQPIGITGWLLFCLAILTSPAAGADPTPPADCSQNPVPLTCQVSQGGTLVISSPVNCTFDPGISEVSFSLPGGKSKSEKPLAISRDGRTLVVSVPATALTGEISIKYKDAGQDKTSKMNLTISEAFEADYWWLYTMIYFAMAVIPVLFFVWFLLWLFPALKRGESGWKLGQALAEQIEEKAVLEENGKPVYKRDSQGQPTEPVYVIKTVYSSSSSRLIAFIGLFAIVTWILAILMPATYRYARTGEIPDLGYFTKFILAQAGIFTPYIVNKITGVFTQGKLTEAAAEVTKQG